MGSCFRITHIFDVKMFTENLQEEEIIGNISHILFSLQSGFLDYKDRI